MRALARRAALVGGETVRGGVAPTQGAPKGLPGDWVTEVDLASEAAIAGFLAAETPEIRFSGEESGGGQDPVSVGWSIRSTAPRTSCTASGPSASR